MRLQCIISVLCICFISLTGCSTKKTEPWIDLAEINEEIVREESKSSVIDAAETTDSKGDREETKIRDLSEGDRTKNTYLQKVKKSSSKGPKVTGTDEGIQLNFDNADIYEVIQVITETLNMNYIVDPSVKGVVNIRSGDKIPKNKLYEVFQKILNINGLNIRSEGDYYYIYPSKQASSMTVYSPAQSNRLKESPRMVIQIMPVMHISATAAAKLVEPYLSDHGTIHMLPDHNSIIIADFESKVLDVLTVLSKLDISPLATLKVRLVRVDKAPLFTLRDELVEILNALKVNQKDHEGVTVLPLERVNSLLLVGGNEELLKSAERWILELDVMPSEGRDNIYIYNVRNSVASDLAGLVNDLISGKSSSSGTSKSASQKKSTKKTGTTTKRSLTKPRTTSPGGAGLGSADLGFAGEPILLPDDSRNIILLRALPPDYNRLVKLLERLDNLPRQVLIEVMIAEVKLSESWEMGVEWTLQNKNLTNNGSQYQQIFKTDLPLGNTGFSYSILNSAGDVVGLLNAIADENPISILSSPQIMVLNNEEATVNVGDQVPIVTSSIDNSATGGDNVRTVQYKDTGVILSVTPRINYNGIIILDINQQVSLAEENKTSGIDTPTISSREIKTKLAVKNAQTILMGGLIEKKEDITQSGVPLLMNIPLLGWLFKYRKESTTSIELLMMITPYVIESENVLDQYVQKFKERLDELHENLNEKKEKQDAADNS